MTPYHPLSVNSASASVLVSGALLFLDGWKAEISWGKSAENGASDKEIPVNPPVPHAELIATYKRAVVDAAHKFGLIKAVATKGPQAIKTAVDTAAKAAKRKDAFARKLAELGVKLKD